MNDLPQKDSWLHRSMRAFIFRLVHIFYPKIEIRGRENLPTKGPVIFVANHPNGLLDPIVMMIGLHRALAFLAKSTLFAYPVLRTFVEAFGALPVFRRQDDGARGGSSGDATERNEQTFARCRQLLSLGGAMALFPEGTTHSDPELRPLRTGAARIALSAEANADWSMGAKIVPVGLWYQGKVTFRSSVLLVIGEPFTLTQYVSDYTADEHQTVDTVNDKIEAGLDRVVLQAENAELLASLPMLAAWTAPQEKKLTLLEQHAWTAKLLTAYNQLRKTDPDRLASLEQQARNYANILYALGIHDPWALESPIANRRRIYRLIIKLALSFPLAIAGLIMSYIPYRLAGPLARLIIGKDPTQIGTAKLLSGMILVFMAWVVEGVLCGRWFGWPWGIAVFIVGLPLSYMALRWAEALDQLRDLVTGKLLRLTSSELTAALMRQRETLAKQIIAAVQEIDSSYF